VGRSAITGKQDKKRRTNIILPVWAGFQGRTSEDIQIDKMNTQIAYMYKLMDADMISPEQTKAEWERMRTEFPEMDIYLLSRKNDKMRDTAYAYNVLVEFHPVILRPCFLRMGLITTKFRSSMMKRDLPECRRREGIVHGALVQMGAELKLPIMPRVRNGRMLKI